MLSSKKFLQMSNLQIKNAKTGSVLVWKAPILGDTSGKDWNVELSTNICDSKTFLNIKQMIVNLAPTLSINNITA